ncbi:TPA: Rrf2 family transcriptional regulator [Patescibacteria group bacterium]|nr:Rrf2 family transcriptional regulator [Patescibacteria group bacterium]HCU47667.1 Rrf2 family transcriptional regulator [Patescibacteria group bacterium]
MFGLSTKGDYGLSFLEALAEHPESLVSLKEISKAKRLPLKYIERLAGLLKKAELIKSKEGAGGGYRLAKSPSDIRLINVLTVLEGELAPTACALDPSACVRAGSCLMKHGWRRIHEQIQNLLSHYTLADLIRKEQLTINR